MKLFATTIIAATITATSAFAMLTPEDRAIMEEQRNGEVETIGTEITYEPLFNLTGPSAPTEGDFVTVTLIETGSYDESTDIGQR